MTDSEQQPWGRVDETGTVFVRTADGEREVGQYPDATPEEALAYFERKYADLAGQVGLLEQRARRGAPAADVAKAVANLRDSVAEAHAVGDLDALARRLEALSGTAKELTEQQQAEAKAALDEAIAERTRIVEQAEALAAQDPAKTQWKQATAELDALFASWQQHQQDGPRLPKNEANELWKRFRTARSTIEQHRKAFFAELDAAHRDVRTRKQALIERAEALAPRGADAVADYRALLDEWKLAGRAGKKLDDALWAKFKAAGDVLFQAKAEVDAQEDEAYRANLTEKLALLDEAEKLLTVDRPEAGAHRAQPHPAQLGRDRPRAPRPGAAGRGPPAQGREPRALPRGRALAARGPREEGALRGHARPAAGRDREARGRARRGRGGGRRAGRSRRHARRSRRVGRG